MAKVKRVQSEELRLLIGRIGASKAGKRLGRSVSTIRRWLKIGAPEANARIASVAWYRSERSKKGNETRKRYIELGLTRIKNMNEIDKLIGAEPGQTKEWMRIRREFWWDKRGEEIAPTAEFVIDKDGRLFRTDKEGVLWRGYTVEGKLFWTRGTYLEGYETAEDFVNQYGSLQGYSVSIYF